MCKITTALVALLFLFSCQSEYTTTIRNDSKHDVVAEFSNGDLDKNKEPAYTLLLDTCCYYDEANGGQKIICKIKPGAEVWIGQEYKSFNVIPPLDWENVVVRTAENKKTTINAFTITFLISEHSTSRSCGDCGPLRVIDIISIK